MNETLSFVEDEHPLLNRVSLETRRGFVDRAKPPQFVADINEIDIGGALSISVIKCRYHTLTENGA